MSGELKTPQRVPFDRVVLVLQGGGALGAYQAGVYQALHDAKIDVSWICGTSIGGINGALIAGNRPERGSLIGPLPSWLILLFNRLYSFIP